MKFKASTNEGDQVAISSALQGKVGVDEVDIAGRTALMLAAQAGSVEAVRVLLLLGADINKRDREGRPAIYFAIMGNNVDVARELVNSGADINYEGDSGEGLLLIADQNSIDRRMEEGIDDQQMAELLLSVDMVRHMVESKDNITPADYTNEEEESIVSDLKANKPRFCKTCDNALKLDLSDNGIDWTLTCQNGCTSIHCHRIIH